MPRVSKAEFIKLQKKLVTDAAIGEKLGSPVGHSPAP